MRKNSKKQLKALPENEGYVSRVYKNKAGFITTAFVNGLKIKPSVSFPGWWADENGDIWSELPFKQNSAMIKRGERTTLCVNDKLMRLKPRYNDGIRFLKPYPRVQYPAFIGEDVNSHNVRVHIIVCEAWNGIKPFEGAVVDHIDGDKHNNRPDNLEWVTTKENNRRALEIGLVKRGKNGRFMSINDVENDEITE